VSSLERTIAAARRDPDRAVLEGFHAVKHAVRFGADLQVVVTPDADAVRGLIASLAPDLPDPVELGAVMVDEPTWHTLTAGGLPSPLLAVATRPAVDAGDVLRAPGDAAVVLLEDPTHLGNLGAVVRVAAAADTAGVLTTGRADPWHPTAVRAGAGLQFAVPTARMAELPDDLDRPLVCLDADGLTLGPGVLPRRALLAFGSERRGLSPAMLARADLTVAIPMRAGVSSLNLATAVAITLYAS